MEARQIRLVQESFAIVLPHMSKITRVLYKELFDRRPDLKALFTRDIREQRKRLLRALIFIINHLDKPEILFPYVKESASRHVTYGVKADDYEVFTHALLFALSAAFGDDFDKDTKQAWRSVFTTLSNTMIESVYKKEVVQSD